jgi:UDPglucose--hexose-1-phosphate uridylyltransferase
MHELRKDPLTGRWVVVLDYSLSPDDYGVPEGEPSEGQCALCEGRESELPPETASVRREGTQPNGPGWWARAVPAPRAFLCEEGGLGRKGLGMYDRMNGIGVHEVLVETPEHARRPEDAGAQQLRRVIELYRMRMESMEKDAMRRYALLCKNSGSLAGSAYSHPHSVLLATPVIPQHIKGELDGAKQYYTYKERCIFCDLMQEETRSGERMIAETGHFVAFCPYAPRVPFEFWIMPKAHSCAFQEAGPGELDDLSGILTSVIRKLRAVLRDPPYSLVIHNAPNRVPRRDHWHTLGDDFHWHMEVRPALRPAPVSESCSDFHVLTTSPEDAAKYIREA